MKLFLMNGYEQTSINLIIETIGISKGTFYYYFKSKEELLDAIVTLKSEEVVSKIRPIVNDSHLNAIEKLNDIYQYAIRVKADMKDLIQMLLTVWLNDDYLYIRHKMEQQSLKVMIPEMNLVIEQGMKERLFNIASSKGVGELLLKLGTIINDTILQMLNKYDMKPPEHEAEYIVDLYQMSLERILGAPVGSIKIFNTQALLEMFR